MPLELTSALAVLRREPGHALPPPSSTRAEAQRWREAGDCQKPIPDANENASVQAQHTTARITGSS